MWFFKKKNVNKIDSLLINATKQLNKIEQQKFDTESLQKLTKLIRIFLKEKYELSQALTIKELNTSIEKKSSINKKIKLQIITLMEKIRSEEYLTKKAFTKTKLNALIKETRNLFNSTRQKHSS